MISYSIENSIFTVRITIREIYTVNLHKLGVLGFFQDISRDKISIPLTLCLSSL